MPDRLLIHDLMAVEVPVLQISSRAFQLVSDALLVDVFFFIVRCKELSDVLEFIFYRLLRA